MVKQEAQFCDQHIIITGGSSGIGKAIANLFAQLGANISIIGRNSSKLTIASQEISASTINAQQKVLAIKADVTQQKEILDGINEAIATLGTPQILITSAGVAIPGYFQEQSLTVFEETMAVNYFGSLYAIKAVLPMMIAAQQGQLVLISSGAGLIGLYGYTTYSPTKFALRGLAESLRGELKSHNIQVAIVYPPDTDTPQLATENLTKPPETKLITATAKLWSAEGIAQQIVRGIVKKQFAIAPGWEMTLLNRFHSLLRGLLNWYFDGIVRRYQNKKGQKIVPQKSSFDG